MIRLIVSDLDGTLMHDDRSVPARFYEQFHELRRRGILFVPASGNQVATMRHILAPIADELTYIADNGGLITRGEEIIYEQPIPEAALLTSLELLKQYPQCIKVFNGREGALIPEADRERSGEALIYLQQHKYVDDLANHPQCIYKFAIADFTGHIAEICAALRPHLPAGVRLATSGNGWMDVTNENANKGLTVAWLQDHLGIAPEETLAFGDQMNDAEMLGRAKYSFAMANCDPNLRVHARSIAPSNQEDGVVQILDQLLNGTLPLD